MELYFDFASFWGDCGAFFCQLATANGPLAEEPLYGVCFVVEAIDVALPPHFDARLGGHRALGHGDCGSGAVDGDPDGDPDGAEVAAADVAGAAAAGGAMGGLHVAKAAKLACRAALLSHR